MPISRKPLSKAEKSLVAVCVFIALPLSGIVFLYGGRDAEPKWNIAPATVRPKPNGYDFYSLATIRTVRFKPEVDPASDTSFNPPNSPYALKNYSLVRRQQWLKANAGMWSLVNQGLRTPSMAPDFAGASSGNWGGLRQLARDMSARTRTFQMANQPMKATISALDTMQMGQDTTRDGELIARLVGIAIMAIGRAPLEDWNKTINALNGSEARTAARRLEAIIARDPSLTRTQTIVKREILIELKRMFASQGWRRTTVAPTQSGVIQNALTFWRLQTISKQTIYDNLNRVLDAEIANAKLPFSKSQTVSPPPDLDVFTQIFIGSGLRTRQNETRHRTSINMLLLRLALRGYIAEHDAAPPTLAALVPSYLKSIPTDVYNDGKPLVYTPQGKTYKLWSVGPDGVNDGGVPLVRRPGATTLRPSQNLLDNKGDFVAGLCQ